MFHSLARWIVLSDIRASPNSRQFLPDDGRALGRGLGSAGEAGRTPRRGRRIDAVVEMKRRNPRWGCPRIAQQIALAFGIEIDKDVVRRVLSIHYRPEIEWRWSLLA